jgi:hypothetical protein
MLADLYIERSAHCHHRAALIRPGNKKERKKRKKGNGSSALINLCRLRILPKIVPFQALACSGSFIAREIRRAQAETRVHRPSVHPSRVLEDDFMQILIFPTKGREKRRERKKKRR